MAVSNATLEILVHFIPPIESTRLDFDPVWEEIGCQADDIRALAKKGAQWFRMSVPSLKSVHVLCRFTFSYPAMNLSLCVVPVVQ